MNKIDRRAASESAKASVELEGYVVSMDTLAESEKYIKNEISFQELIKNLYKQSGIFDKKTNKN
ncbi:MAG: hypothetical protein ACTJH7_04315 [Alcaligenes sp.]